MLLKFVTLFQSFNAIQCYALYHLHAVIASPLALIIQCSCYFPPLLFTAHNTPLLLQLANKIEAILLGFAQSLFAIFVIPIPLLSAHPSSYFASQLFPQLHFTNVVVKLLFPSTFFYLCRSNHTNQVAASITQNVTHLLHSYNIRHFYSKRHLVSHFDSTSARHPLHHFIDFRPTYSYFNFNIFMLLMFNNV